MRRAGRIVAGVLAIALAACAAACNVLAPQKDESKFFLLTPVGASAAVAPASQGGALSIGLGPVNFPQYLKRPEIVTRIGSDQLELSENRRWAEPLDANFQSVLAQDLARQLGSPQITPFPWYGTAHFDYQVEIQVSRFDVSSDGEARLTARWTIRDGANRNVLFATETTATAQVAAGDPAGSAALSQDVGELSRQIADRIRELGAGGAMTSKS